jgi:hypothetical protein
MGQLMGACDGDTRRSSLVVSQESRPTALVPRLTTKRRPPTTDERPTTWRYSEYTDNAAGRG